MERLFGALVILLALTAEARAAKLIAVLPLDVRMTSGKLSPAAQASLEEMLRDAATNALSPAGWTVLTGETTIQVLRDNDVKPEECGNESCHLEMAREIKAERFLSGSVQYVEGQFIASVRLIDTKTGRIVASERATAKSVTKLRESFEAKAGAFFRRGFSEAGATNEAAPVETSSPQVKSSQITAAVGSLTVTAKPLGLVRLELEDPKGRKFSSGAPYKNESALPGRWKVIAKASGYSDEEQIIDVRPDDVSLGKFDLSLLGGLSITGEPMGAAIVVTGPREFRNEGGLPWAATGLRRGTYQVRVTRTGYYDATEQVEVNSGETAKLRVVLERDTGSRREPPPTDPTEIRTSSSGRFASLFVETTPPGAKVLINASPMKWKVTPLTVPDLVVGQRVDVKVFMKGYAPVEKTYVMTGRDDRVSAFLSTSSAADDATNDRLSAIFNAPNALIELSTGEVATLQIACSPQAMVLIDGRKVGRSQLNALYRYETTPGRHRVACETETGAKAEKEIELSGGETQHVDIRVQ